MPESNNEMPKLLDEAIAACDAHVKSHRSGARWTIIVLVVLMIGFVMLLYGIAAVPTRGFLEERLSLSSELTEVLRANIDAAYKAETERRTVTNYVILAMSVLVFGVLMAIYRFHLTEIAKAEHYKIGFLRIRIAANNTSVGFQTEVRQSLTANAFEYVKSGTSVTQRARIESALPGHPTSDFASALLNRIVEQLELRAEAKKIQGGST